MSERFVDAGAHRGSLLAGGLALGIGLGGFVDGILFHQVLRWHHMLSATVEPASVADLELNVLWDGLFHVVTWTAVLVGVGLLGRLISFGAWWPRRALWGLVVSGWGIFNLVEGMINHHLLGIHHVRDDVADPRWWDAGFLTFGALLVICGWALARRSLRRPM